VCIDALAAGFAGDGCPMLGSDEVSVLRTVLLVTKLKNIIDTTRGHIVLE